MSAPQFSKGRRKRRRGLHKQATSPGIKRWEREELVPEQPPWMSRETYVALARLRAELARV